MENKKRYCWIGILLAIFIVSGCAHTTVKTVVPEIYRVDALDVFMSGASSVNTKYIFSVGSFEDKTGKFADGTQVRYSRAVTQGGRDLLMHFLLAGGFRVADRDPYNIQLIANEYKMAHTYIQGPNGDIKKQVGLVKRDGPNAGLQGVTHLITGAITTYQVDHYSGGGGLEVNAIGTNFQFAQAVVGLNIRILDLATSEVLSSTIELAKVRGWKIGLNAMQLITSSGQVATVSAEAGLASQFPADFALSEALITGLGRTLSVKGAGFYTKPVDFTQMFRKFDLNHLCDQLGRCKKPETGK